MLYFVCAYLSRLAHYANPESTLIRVVCMNKQNKRLRQRTTPDNCYLFPGYGLYFALGVLPQVSLVAFNLSIVVPVKKMDSAVQQINQQKVSTKPTILSTAW